MRHHDVALRLLLLDKLRYFAILPYRMLLEHQTESNFSRKRQKKNRPFVLYF